MLGGRASRTCDGFGIYTDVEALVEQHAGSGVVHQDVNCLIRTRSDLESEAPATGGEKSREAPAVVGAAHHDDSVAIVDAEHEARAELIHDDDAASTLQHIHRNRHFRIGHEFLQNGLTGLDAFDIVSAGNSLSEERRGEEGGQKGESEKLFHVHATGLICP